MMNSVVSIIVPVYNAELYLEECIISIVSQTYKDLEIILVDDGSSDKSPEICDLWMNRDNRIKVVHKENGGLSDARNAGLDVATGKYVTFTDSDDIIDSSMIENMVKLIEENNVKMVSCESVFYQNGEERVIPHYHREESISTIGVDDFLKGLLSVSIDCSVCNKLFLREAIGDLRFEVGKYNEDILFMFELVPSIHNIVHTNAGYYKYRVSDGSITHTFNARSLDQFYNAEKIYSDVASRHPNLIQYARRYLIYVSQGIVTKICQEKLQFKEPYATAYCRARQVLVSNIFFVAISRLIPFRRKASIIKTLYLSK